MTERIEINDAPPCPLCAAPVDWLVLEAAGHFYRRPVLEPCGHEMQEATYYNGPADDPPRGWSWTPPAVERRTDI